MAEQDVCADDVVKTKGKPKEGVEGESLLLPLLQGLLVVPDNEQTADSGTESGEDLRSGLLVEVQNVLTKLANSLKSDSNEMNPEKRSSLLQLVTRLQNGLVTQQPSAEESRSNNRGRFSRRRRHNRHTVGVSSEELEDARRLIKEIGLSNATMTPQIQTPLQKQKSEGNVVYQKLNPIAVKNSVAKPYGSSTSSSTVDTPTEASEVLDFLKPVDTSVLCEPTKVSTYASKPEMASSNFLMEFEKKPEPQKSEHPSLLNTAIYAKPKISESEDDLKLNKFNNKKIKMKRANTIDIPKPANFYESEEDYESDASFVDKQSARRSNYLALRGPIRVGRNSVTNTNLPMFEPKTESDKKFMAFINKHNESSNKGSLWTQQNNKPENHWTNRFGNIRTAFEKASTSTPSTPNMPINSAKNFWKAADAKINTPKQVFETKEKERKSPWIDEKNVITGTLKMDTKGIDTNKTYKFVPQHLPVNKFSHAPTSAFAAIPKKDPPEITSSIPKDNHTHIQTPSFIKSNYKDNSSNTNTPLYLYSPKPIQPTPWTNDEHRVSKLPTSKFEKNPESSPQLARKQLKTIKDKCFNTFQTEESNQKPGTPYLSNSSSVRKLSDQFNNKPIDTYSSYTTVKYGHVTPTLQSQPQPHLQPQPQPLPQPQNYSIVYDPYRKYPQQPEKQIPETGQPQYKKYVHNYHPQTATIPESHTKPQPPEYTSQQFIQFKQDSNPSSSDSSPTPFRNTQYNRQQSQDSVKEYDAAVTKVMKGPITHQAVTVQQKSPKGRDQHDMEVALNLKNVLQKFAKPESTERKFSYDSTITERESPLINLQRSQSLKKSNPQFLVNGKSLSMESTEINEDGESVITSKFHIPVMINAKPQPSKEETSPIRSPTRRSKSSHNLAVPTVQFQAGMTKDEVVQKKRTVEAYFSGKISPQSLSKTPSDDSLDKSDKTEGKTNKTSINRKKTSEKVSIHKQGVVSRSRTLPNLLDESKVDESFEDLFRSNV